MKSIGIYPGTFDPIHKGHTSFAASALSMCGLDAVCFLPERKPRNKTSVTVLDTRIDTVRRSIVNNPKLSVISVESDQFTVTRTLPEIEALIGPAHFTLLIGSDVAMHIASWPSIETLAAGWRLAIGMRNDDSTEEIESHITEIEHAYGLSIERTYIHTDMATVSSSQVRQKQK